MSFSLPNFQYLLCLALAIAKAFLGTSFVIVEPAAIYALSLTFTGDTKISIASYKSIIAYYSFKF